MLPFPQVLSSNLGIPKLSTEHDQASYSAFVPPASLWNKCAPVEITVSETQTVIQPGSTVTVLDASTSKSGVVVKTVSATASSPLKRRNFPGYSSNCVTVSLPSFYGYCSASTVTKTVVQYTTSTLPASTIIKTSLDIQPGEQHELKQHQYLERLHRHAIASRWLRLIICFHRDHSYLYWRLQNRCHCYKVDISKECDIRYRSYYSRHPPGIAYTSSTYLGV